MLLIRGPGGVPAHTAKVHLRRRKNMELREHVGCWHAARNASGLIAGRPEDYLMPRLFLSGKHAAASSTNSSSLPRRTTTTSNDVT